MTWFFVGKSAYLRGFFALHVVSHVLCCLLLMACLLVTPYPENFIIGFYKFSNATKGGSVSDFMR